MDIWTKEKRSEVMSKIRSKNTLPEIQVRKILFSSGFRYRLHVKNLPGKPDIVLPKYNSVIFVHGCFWHLHAGCRDGTIPKTRTTYWKDKLLRNKERDKEHMHELQKQGWRVLILWECEVENKSEELLEKLNNYLGIVD
ncbi:MAG: DNA mismatch endonuclease Vsr [Bacteroidetes bacterium]|nr:DNA mismatch endonuclease Vsr [Bacteroidota bacterium]